LRAFRCFAEQALTFLPPICRAPQGKAVPVRTNVVVTQLLHQLLFKCRRNGMFQTFCLFVNLIPWHAKDLSEHALNEVMAKDGLFGNLLSGADVTDDTCATPSKPFLRICNERWLALG
jgi:hypothetical protein